MIRIVKKNINKNTIKYFFENKGIFFKVFSSNDFKIGDNDNDDLFFDVNLTEEPQQVVQFPTYKKELLIKDKCDIVIPIYNNQYFISLTDIICKKELRKALNKKIVTFYSIEYNKMGNSLVIYKRVGFEANKPFDFIFQKLSQKYLLNLSKAENNMLFFQSIEIQRFTFDNKEFPVELSKIKINNSINNYINEDEEIVKKRIDNKIKRYLRMVKNKNFKLERKRRYKK